MKTAGKMPIKYRSQKMVVYRTKIAIATAIGTRIQP